MDLLDDLDEIKVCTSYERKYDVDGTTKTETIVGRLPAKIAEFGEIEAIYTTFPGWKQDTRQINNFDDLPEQAQTLIRFIEK